MILIGAILNAVLSLQAPLSAGPFLKISNNLSDVADASTSRTNLGLAIGTDVQAQDAELQAIAGLVSAADKLPYFTGSGTASLSDLSSYGRTLIDDANEATARTTLGLASGGAGDIWVEKAGDTMGGALTVQGILTMASELQHEGNIATKIGFTTDKIALTAGGSIALAITETTQNLIEVGNASDWDVNFNAGQMFLRGSDGFFGIGTASPSATLHTLTTTGSAGVELFRADASEGGHFRVFDAASSGFIASFEFLSNGINGIAGSFTARVPAANDVLVGTLAGMVIDVRQGASGSTPVSNINLFQIRNGTTPKFTIDVNGNVGIGTTAPGSLTEWNFTTEDLEFVDAGSAAATEQDWIEVNVGGAQGFIHVHAAK